ncbi:Rieske 2Fe-2S domain-containing protein [Oculatella sp. LEGE 06141]|nr:Rieske 2Fe-2S domain-containing protein [Oculatella sp. LEGE 06141]
MQGHNPSRRLFLRYFVGGTVSTIALSYWFPKTSRSQEPDLETLCSLFPLNSRCETYLPGVQALDQDEVPIGVSALLTQAQPGDRVLALGLERESYLVIDAGPEIATYGISSVCTHLGCTVDWDAERDRFVCPCHGSEYDDQGRVTEGPARRLLELVTVVVKQDQARLVQQAPAIDPRELSGSTRSSAPQ